MGILVDVPAAVRLKASAVGADGERWLAELGQTLADLEAEWEIRVGAAIVGGSGAYVVHAVMADGTPAVLKLAIPDGLEGQGPFERELRSLLLGDGHGYVRVLRADDDRRAMLQELLGRPLGDLGWPIEAQIEVIASTLQEAWRPMPAGPSLRTGAEQAAWLEQFIRARWDELGRPCPQPTIERALTYARDRAGAFDAATSVLIHGDAHPGNILADPTRTAGPRPGRFKLIDPDGMVSEPAHDLAIPLRDWSRALLDGDPVGLALAWCAQLGDLTGVDARAIWQWAFVERVSTGLFLIQLGDARGADLLAVAAAWTAVAP